MGITSTLRRAFEKKQQIRQTAVQEYASLLHQQLSMPESEWEKVNEKRAMELVDILGKEAAHVAADEAVVSEMHRHAALIATLPAAIAAVDAANAESARAYAERQKVYREQNAKCTTAQLAADQAITDLANVHASRRTLGELREQHPHLAM